MKFEDIKGMIFTGITGVDTAGPNHEGEVIFTADDGRQFKMYHRQECCESVYLAESVFESATGTIEDMLHTPILVAEEVITEVSTDYGSSTHTFYKLATLKGYLTLRWIGESNGYYSERVDFEQITQVS